MTNPSESISVIIPVYNGEKYLKEAIKSVLDQKHPAQELLIVDDGSTDGTKDLVEGFRGLLRYINKEHTGLGDTMNRGIAEVNNDLIAFLDADDIWTENKLEIQATAIKEHDVDMVFGYMHQFISPELTEEEISKIHCPKQDIPGYSSDTILVRREVFNHTGLFSNDYQVGEFIDWFLRAKDKGFTSVMLPDMVVKRRLHKSNMTGQGVGSNLDYVRILKANLDRRRKSNSI